MPTKNKNPKPPCKCKEKEFDSETIKLVQSNLLLDVMALRKFTTDYAGLANVIFVVLLVMQLLAVKRIIALENKVFSLTPAA